MWIMGTDEAGYGPNLGPLVISATLWQLPDGDADGDMYDRLAAVVTRDPPSGKVPDRVPIADSKVLYKGQGSLANLEYGLGAALWAVGIRPENARALGTYLTPDALDRKHGCPWHDLPDAPFPQDAARTGVQELGDALKRAMEAAAVRLHAIRSRAVFPGEFNETVERLGNKAEALSTWTLQLVKQLLETTAAQPVLIHCDKHGGRNRYGALLQHAFPDHLVRVHTEGRETSLYEWNHDGRPVTARFVAKGENFLPSALASIAAKYFRELAMQAFNAFWQRHVPGLKPTAGYPVDARRFLADIGAAKEKLGVPDDQLWRRR